MAHVKAGSSSAHQKANVVGKHRGMKVNQGQFVRGGQILVRQTGVVYKAGMNTKLSRDHSVISRVAGIVKFSYIRRPQGVRTVLNIVPSEEKKKVPVVKTKTAAVKTAKVEKAVVAKVAPVAKAEKVVAKKAPAKKVAAKKPAVKKTVK